MRIGIARKGPNDELLDIWEVSEELYEARIQFINIWNGLLVHSGLYYKSTDVHAQVRSLL